MKSSELKTVLITGGAKRIGAALVRAFAGRNWRVCIHCNQSRTEAESLLRSLDASLQHWISCCDLSDPVRRKAWLDGLPGFDLVINNASCYRLTPKDCREKASDRERYWQVNYHAPLEIIAHQQKHLAAGCRALAITLLDCDVLNPEQGIKEFTLPEDGGDSYLATRIALAHKLMQLARSCAPGLRIGAIAPGPVLPPVDCVTAGMTVILDKVPMHQVVGVQEIVNAALFLQDNPSLTGVIVPVDGGMHLGCENKKGF